MVFILKILASNTAGLTAFWFLSITCHLNTLKKYSDVHLLHALYIHIHCGKLSFNSAA